MTICWGWRLCGGWFSWLFLFAVGWYNIGFGGVVLEFLGLLVG